MEGKIKDKFKFFVRTHRKIGILYDSIKGFFVALILLTLIVFFASAIIHNILRVVEASNEYKGKYKKLYYAGDGMMNIYTVGDGYRPVVILPQIGDYSPVMKYKALADTLSSQFTTVIAEPLGYGYSLSSKKPRTSKNIIKELREALDNAEINGPYILLTFGDSSLYANYYSQEYPEEVLGIISINGLYSESLNDDSYKDKYLPNYISNVKFYSMVSFSGLFRWKSYISPADFDIDNMQNNSSYGKDEIKLYRNRLANKFITKEMKKEAEKIEENMKAIKDYKYPENLLTLQIMTTNYRDEYLDREENITKHASNLITNKDYQKIRTIKGDITDYLYSKDGLRDLKNIIGSHF